LHIQSRVAAELAALQARASKDYEELQAKLSAADETPKSDKTEKSAGDTIRDLGRESVQNELDGLKKKLESRKQAREEDEGVKKAKEEVVNCLRTNDRRPLDCWKEVSKFREEVRRLEGKWVEGIVR